MSEQIILQIGNKDTVKRFYYHVSDCLKNKNVLIEPKIPFEATDSEPDVERICVSPSLSQCIIAIHHKLSAEKEFNCYRTKHKITGFFPIGVRDRQVTEERWITKHTKFIRVFNYNPDNYSKEVVNKFKCLLKEANSCWAKYGAYPDLDRLEKSLTEIQNFLLEIKVPP